MTKKYLYPLTLLLVLILATLIAHCSARSSPAISSNVKGFWKTKKICLYNVWGILTPALMSLSLIKAHNRSFIGLLKDLKATVQSFKYQVVWMLTLGIYAFPSDELWVKFISALSQIKHLHLHAYKSHTPLKLLLNKNKVLSALFPTLMEINLYTDPYCDEKLLRLFYEVVVLLAGCFIRFDRHQNSHLRWMCSDG